MRSTERPRQLPLALDHVAQVSRDDLIVTPSNAEAFALIDRWPDWHNPVAVLAGPPGSGKSHLAAIWREASGASALSRETAAAEMATAARHGPVLIDGIDGAPLDERGLFHLINAVRDAGTTLLLTARRFPAGWGVTLPDLASRLRTATVTEIREPDDALLAGVITKLFADRQLEVEPHVVRFLVRRIERSLATACRVVEKLDRASLEGKTRISRALAAAVLGAEDEGQAELDL